MKPSFESIRLNQEFNIKPFDCGDDDLNDFLLIDAKQYYQKLLAVTYILNGSSDTIAFFSLLNDKITLTD